MKGPSGSPYDFEPKIVDFGLYSRVGTAKANASGEMGLDHSGTQRYSKPHCVTSHILAATQLTNILLLKVLPSVVVTRYTGVR